MSLLSLKNASISFGGDPLLNNVTLNIEEGEHICLVGRNGAGKSTLLKILSGELTPDKGELIRKDGIRILSLPQDVPQDITGYVRDIVGDTPEANAAITRLKLNKDDHFESLSGGLKRRALLARALAHNPDNDPLHFLFSYNLRNPPESFPKFSFSVPCDRLKRRGYRPERIAQGYPHRL